MQSQPAGVQAGHRASLPGQHHAHAHDSKTLNGLVSKHDRKELQGGVRPALPISSKQVL